MDVQVQRAFIVPAPPSESSSSEVPPTVFDLVAPAYHVTVLFAYAPPNPTNAALLDALAATLTRFPLLTARRLGCRPRAGRPLFVTGEGGAGALVVEAAVPSPLSDHLPLAPSPDLARLHVPVDKATPHVLLLQINRFACGGLVVASSTHHQAADGYSMSTFFHAWAGAVRASGAHQPLIDRPVVPYGPCAIAPRRPPRCEFEHRGAEFLSPQDAAIRQPPARVHPSEIANLLLHYTSEFVAELKARAGGGRYTTFEAVSAHLWRKITAARGRGDDDPSRTALNVTVNGRARLGADAVPRGFFGNVVLTASSGTSARELARGSLADAAALVRAGVRARDRRYFQSFIDFGALHGGEELEPTVGDEDNVLLPDVASDSWLHLELHRLDFGCGGRLAGILPARSPLDGVVVLIPSLGKGGGVDVFVSLWDKHAEVLRDIAYTMD
ncbi:Agmatine coumaroyltransferase-1 [Dichanthelium oligosanthes]|uniref:Agmatine coumaroyltransferase-1 n=1 Tax=Dichanthelium oligosanthes TaxID=888268 RepID=A0A1E5V428_9POAL|nr:Agmatine coumaroyltransferase-1 [Dichanthelium oligosanthes]